MKLAQLSTRFPPGPGGVERHVFEISRRLVSRGHAVTAYTSDLYREFPWQRLEPSIPRDDERDGIRIRRLRAWSLPGELHYPFLRGLGQALARGSPDLLHAHTYGTHHASVARRYSRRAGVPYVLTAHFHPIWSIYGGWMRHRLRAFYDQVLAGPVVGDASMLIVQSQEEERLLRVTGVPLPRTACIPPGYTPLPPPPAGERPFSKAFGIDGPFVLFVGRLASNKGLLPLAGAFRTLDHHDPSARLVLIGEDGGERARFEARARELGISGRILVTGFLPDERLLSAAFQEARVFALPSEYEAFGLVLLEALAQGTPVIASRVGGIPEFVEDGRAGVLVPPLDETALAEALLRLWDDEPLRQTLGRFGRDQVVPRFSWDRVTDRLVEVYREALGS